uniref:Retrotransposon gag domain-containing protein n=1 Tax=Arundo donax TaxID=35708 RepID=A0A0A9EUL1_ARUDO
MQLSHTIAPHAVGAAEIPPHEVAKASIFMRLHIHPDLKMEYLEVHDSLALWSTLQECFGKQKAIILPQARRDWGQLRFLDYKIVGEYNTAFHRIVSQLRLYGQRVTESKMIDKTLETFHPPNMVLQQRCRNNKYKKYSKLIQVLLAAAGSQGVPRMIS